MQICLVALSLAPEIKRASMIMPEREELRFNRKRGAIPSPNCLPPFGDMR
jgi:hypothetical protein